MWQKERKEKIMPVSRYRRECEPINLMLITVIYDATQRILPLYLCGTWHNEENFSTFIASMFMIEENHQESGHGVLRR